MFEKIPPNVMIIATTIMAIGMGIVVTTLRAKAAKHPASVKKSYYHRYSCLQVQ